MESSEEIVVIKKKGKEVTTRDLLKTSAEDTGRGVVATELERVIVDVIRVLTNAPVYHICKCDWEGCGCWLKERDRAVDLLRGIGRWV